MVLRRFLLVLRRYGREDRVVDLMDNPCPTVTVHGIGQGWQADHYVELEWEPKWTS